MYLKKVVQKVLQTKIVPKSGTKKPLKTNKKTDQSGFEPLPLMSCKVGPLSFLSDLHYNVV